MQPDRTGPDNPAGIACHAQQAQMVGDRIMPPDRARALRPGSVRTVHMRAWTCAVEGVQQHLYRREKRSRE